MHHKNLILRAKLEMYTVVLEPNANSVAAPIRDSGRGVHVVPGDRRGLRHQQRSRAVGARLAVVLRPGHPGDDRRRSVRNRASDDRDRGRYADHYPGDLDRTGREEGPWEIMDARAGMA